MFIIACVMSKAIIIVNNQVINYNSYKEYVFVNGFTLVMSS